MEGRAKIGPGLSPQTQADDVNTGNLCVVYKTLACTLSQLTHTETSWQIFFTDCAI